MYTTNTISMIYIYIPLIYNTFTIYTYKYLHVWVCIYIHIKYTQYTHVYCVNINYFFILDAINHLTAQNNRKNIYIMSTLNINRNKTFT